MESSIVDKEEHKHITIQIKKETHKRLKDLIRLLNFKDKKEYTFNDIISILLDDYKKNNNIIL